MFRRVPKYTKSLVKESMSPSKYYMTDIGLRNAVLLSQSEDEGKALENIVYMMLERGLKEDDRVFYFSEGKECDFVIQRGDQIEELVQVCWELEETNLEREVGGILAASAVTDCRTCKIITLNQQRIIQRGELRIEVLPIWKL